MASIHMELGWIPPAKLRGNSRGNNSRQGAAARTAVTRKYRKLGLQAGKTMLNDGVKPLTETNLSMYVRVQRKDNRGYDLLNFVFGYKAFEDGLVESGILPDDRHVVRIIAEKAPKGESNHTWLSYEEETNASRE